MEYLMVALTDLHKKILKMDFADLFTMMDLFLKESINVDTDVDMEDIFTTMEKSLKLIIDYEFIL